MPEYRNSGGTKRCSMAPGDFQRLVKIRIGGVADGDARYQWPSSKRSARANRPRVRRGHRSNNGRQINSGKPYQQDPETGREGADHAHGAIPQISPSEQSEQTI